MKVKMTAAIGVLFITTNLIQAQGPATGYAEGIYKEYSTATGGKVVFNVQTVGQGPLSDLAGKPFSTFLAEPTYRVESDQFGTELNNVRFNEPVSSDFITQDMSSLPDHFQDVGLPLQLGVYRRLGLTATRITPVATPLLDRAAAPVVQERNLLLELPSRGSR